MMKAEKQRAQVDLPPAAQTKPPRLGVLADQLSYELRYGPKPKVTLAQVKWKI